MGHGDDHAAQHVLGLRGGHAHLVHGILQPENEAQHVLQLRAEVVVGHLHGVGALLHVEHQGDVLHGHHVLHHRHGHQVGNLLGTVLLAHGIADIPLLHIIADHGGGDFHVPQGGKVAVDILHRLIQIEPYVGNLPVPGQTELLDPGRHRFSPLTAYYKVFIRKRQAGFNISLDRFCENCYSGSGYPVP